MKKENNDESFNFILLVIILTGASFAGVLISAI